MEQLWSMYNKYEKLRIDDLKTEHVRIILLAISTARMGDWYACREGDMQWQPISEIPEFYEDVRALKGLAAQPERPRMLDEQTAKNPVAKAPAPPKTPKKNAPKKPVTPPTFKPGQHSPRRPLFEDAPPDEKTDPVFNVVTSRVKDRRSARRYPRLLEFEVRQGERKFKCKTRDISIGGLSLDQPLPSWVAKTFRATIGHQGVNIRVLCSKVTESKMKIVEAESWDVIRKWIVNW